MYDVIIIGGGPGGYPCAIRSAQAGMKVAIIEKGELGGICLNKGCIPTKTLAAISDEISVTPFKSLEKKTSYQWDKILSEIRTDVVLRLKTGVSFLLKQNKIDLYKGEGKIVGLGSVCVEDKKLESKNIVIATGGTPCTPEICRIGERTITSDTFWKMEKLPESIAIVGGGVIGCEFASIFNKLGLKVSIYEMQDNLIPEGDEDITNLFKKYIENRGVNVLTGKKIDDINDIKEEKILVTVGRQPNIPVIENLDISIEKGAISTDAFMKTNYENIYAVGDVNGKYQFAYIATKEGEIASSNILGKKTLMDYSNIPSTIFTDPEISFCGMTEKEAISKGIKVKVGKFSNFILGRAYTQKNNEGLVKVVANADTEEILGIHIIGKSATELVAFSTLAITNKMKISDLERMIYCHPTYAEGIMEAVEDVKKKSIHLPPSRD